MDGGVELVGTSHGSVLEIEPATGPGPGRETRRQAVVAQQLVVEQQ